MHLQQIVCCKFDLIDADLEGGRLLAGLVFERAVQHWKQYIGRVLLEIK